MKSESEAIDFQQKFTPGTGLYFIILARYVCAVNLNSTVQNCTELYILSTSSKAKDEMCQAKLSI